MTRWPIRVRLGAWFAVVLGLILTVLAGTTWWTVRHRFRVAIDTELADRAESIGRFLGRQTNAASVEEMRDDLQEYVSLDPGWNLVRIIGADGRVVYRSGAFDPVAAPLAASETARGEVYRTVTMRGRLLRMITARVGPAQHVYTVDIAIPLGAFQAALDELGWTLVILMPVGILAAALGGYWISRRALAPVDSITGTARVITARALERRLEVPLTGDELQRLSETLNAMLDRLEASFRETNRFTADVSHELRTPISLIRTSAEIALRCERSPHEYRGALENILREAERMSSVVQDLLTLVRADAGVEGTRRVTLDLRLFIADISHSLEALCASRRLEFRLDLGEQAAWVSADPQSLERLVLILVDNAVQYTPSPGQVALSLRCEGATAAVEVADTGIGIAADDIAHVFDRFYRADRARSHDSGGSGLGLSIAQRIVERHGGRIGIESASGVGCRVRVLLPCVAPEVSPTAAGRL